MNLSLTLPALANLVGVIVGTIVSLVCWFYPTNARSSIRLLGASLFSLTFTLFVFFLSESKLIYSFPHFLHTGFITTLLYMPFSFLFVRSMTQHGNLSSRDFVHAIPVFLFLIDYSVFYFLPADHKLQIIETGRESAYHYQQGLFIPVDLHKPIRFLIFMLYFGLQLRLVLSKERKVKKLLLSYVLMHITLVFFYIIYQFSIDPLSWNVTNIFISFYLICIATVLLFHPKILYSQELSLAEVKLVNKLRRNDAQNGISNGHDNSNGSNGTGEKIDKDEALANRMDAYMKTEMPYLRHSYSIHDLAAALKLPSYQVSHFLNHGLQTSFNDYVNKYRILHSVEKIKQGAASLLTLEALAFDCGFNNRNSFTTAFKRVMGVTPSEFMRLQKLSTNVAKYSNNGDD